MKPFTLIAALIFLAIAAAHAYRIYAGFAVTVGQHSFPMAASWAGAVVFGALTVMLYVESRR